MIRALAFISMTMPLIASCGLVPEATFEPATSMKSKVKQSNQSGSTFEPWISADGRYELRIPIHWYVSTSAEDSDRATALESATGDGAGVSRRKTLLNIRTSKENHFAVFQLTTYPLEGVDQELMSRMTETDLRILERGLKDEMQRIKGNLGFTVVSWDKASFTRVNSMRAWTVGYKFTTEASDAEWHTSIVNLPINGQIIEMSSTYAISKVTLAKPTLSSIVNSFKTRRQ